MMHPKTAEMKVLPPRTGRRLIAPEALGCCNTGTRPILPIPGYVFLDVR